MNQAVLMDADIDKRAKLGDVGDNAFERQAGFEVINFPHGIVELRGDELLARVAAGLLQFLDNVVESIDAGGKAFAFDVREQFRIANQVFDGKTERLRNLLDDGVGLGMHGCGIEGVFAAANAQKSSGLFEGLRADAGHGIDFDAGAKLAPLIAELDDLLRGALGDPCDVTQQRPRGGVEIDADAVHTALYHGFERTLELRLIDVVLILADADRLGIDLD